jgi:sec-independent protein translocase protein TatC
MKNKQISFKFYNFSNLEKKKKNVTELLTTEHIEEIRQRFFQSAFLILFFILFSFLQVKLIVQLLQDPVKNIHFFQTSPGEYFLSTLKISVYTGILFSIPIILSQIIFFLLPGLRNEERITIISLILSSVLLFLGGLLFSYLILIPAALTFFITYSSDVIEPLWSFDQYFNFILVLFLSTGIVFQIPVIQIILSFSKIVSGVKMLKLWKYVFLFSTILGAILTPSADPLTQLLLSGAVFSLYWIGSFVVIILTKNN